MFFIAMIEMQVTLTPFGQLFVWPHKRTHSLTGPSQMKNKNVIASEIRYELSTNTAQMFPSVAFNCARNDRPLTLALVATASVGGCHRKAASFSWNTLKF